MVKVEADRIVDTFGLLCPMPIIKTAEAIQKMRSSQVLEVISTDPGSVSDLKNWCKANKHTYLGEAIEGKVFRIRIRCGGNPD